MRKLVFDMSITILQFRNRLVSLFLFLLPWQTRWIIRSAEIGGAPWEYGTLAFYATEILLWVIIFLGWKDVIRWCARIGAWKWVVCALLALAFLSSAWSPAPLVTFFAVLHLLEAGLLIFILAASSRESFKMFAIAFVLGAVAQSGLGVAQVALQWVHPSTIFGIALHDPIVSGTSVIETATGRFLRAYGGLPHPNMLGGYLAVAIFFIIALVRDVKKRSTWIVMLAASILTLLALFLTFSRSAWIALAAGVLGMIFLIFSRKHGNAPDPIVRFRLASFALAAVVILAICSFAFRDVVATRFTGSTRLETISRAERLHGISDAFVLIKERPLVGSGLGASTFALALRRPGFPTWAYQPVHNGFVLIAVELGAFGVIVILALLIGLWRVASWWWKKSAPEDRVHLAALCSAISVILVISLFDHYLWSLYFGNLLTAVTIGFLLNQANQIP